MALLRLARGTLFRAALQAPARLVVPRAGINSSPPQVKIGVLETMLTMGVFALTIAGPSGWVMSHLRDYRGRE